MTAFLVTDSDVTDPVAYEEYRKLVPADIQARGGRHLARGGASERLEGESIPHRLVIVEFPDMTRVSAFYRSPEYRPLIALRQRASRSSLFAAEGV